jgi:hypothetical protein
MRRARVLDACAVPITAHLQHSKQADCRPLRTKSASRQPKHRPTLHAAGTFAMTAMFKKSPRRLTAISVALLGACTTAPPSKEMPPVAPMILFAGTYRDTGPLRSSRPSSDSPTEFKWTSPGEWVNDQKSLLIPAQLGVSFGVMYGWLSASSAPSEHTVIWRFPSPGVVNPQTRKLWTEYREVRRDKRCVNPYSCGAIWTIDVPAELLPGVWTVEIVEPTGKSVSRSFLVTESLTH